MEKLTDAGFIKEVTEAYEKGLDAGYAVGQLLAIIKRRDELIKFQEETVNYARKAIILQEEKIAKLRAEIRNTDNTLASLDRPLIEVKSEAYKEVAEKITEVFMRYAHLHSYAEGAKKDYIEAVDGTEIEMQSVWDVFTLKKNEMSEYEEMNRLQKNIETIANERLLTELEKDFRLLVKELTEGNDG